VKFGDASNRDELAARAVRSPSATAAHVLHVVVAAAREIVSRDWRNNHQAQ
jgi:hypothetical protein